MVYVPLIVCIAGLILFYACEGKTNAIGKDMFWVGLLVCLSQAGYGLYVHVR